MFGGASVDSILETNTVVHEDDGAIIPPNLAIQAMRDSGYKNTAYALAELIDNSVQAKAKTVEIFCLEQWQQLNERTRKRLVKIAVLDDGEGMGGEVLSTTVAFSGEAVGAWRGVSSGIAWRWPDERAARSTTPG
jgi:hypothetical protein